MTSLMGAKKRAEEFAAVVDGGTDRSGLNPELAELVGVVATLEREGALAAQLAPSPAFTASLREQLMAEAATSLAEDNVLTLPTRRKGGRERRLALVASSLVLVGGTAGMAAAAQNALPGEALYPIKRGLENAQAGLATSQAARGHDLLDQADSRLVEVEGLFDGSGSPSQVSATIDDFTKQANEASAVLLAEFKDTQDPAIIAELQSFAADNLDELQQLAKTAPAQHQEELAVAADALVRIDRLARAACPTCADGTASLKMPPLFLSSVEAKDAMDAVKRVKLDNSHPVMTEDTQPKSGGRDGKQHTGGDATTPTTTTPTGTPDTTDTGGTDGGGLPALPNGGLETNGGDGNSNGGGDVTKQVDKTVKDVKGTVKDSLPDELGPAVDTLIP